MIAFRGEQEVVLGMRSIPTVCQAFLTTCVGAHGPGPTPAIAPTAILPPPNETVLQPTSMSASDTNAHRHGHTAPSASASHVAAGDAVGGPSRNNG